MDAGTYKSRLMPWELHKYKLLAISVKRQTTHRYDNDKIKTRKDLAF